MSAKKKSLRSLALLTEKELANRLHASNTARQFGFALASAGPGRALIRMRVAPRHKQVHGVVHGGVLAALADTAGGLATYMACPRGTRVATLEMKMNYLEPVEKGVIEADARVLRRGRNFAVVDCDVHDDAGRLVAKSLMTFSFTPLPRGSARS
ncbi:MAG: PaaI family thioesterase [Candidatus Acidiferrales bacterium]